MQVKASQISAQMRPEVPGCSGPHRAPAAMERGVLPLVRSPLCSELPCKIHRDAEASGDLHSQAHVQVSSTAVWWGSGLNSAVWLPLFPN